jgi:hypothetical protein
MVEAQPGARSWSFSARQFLFSPAAIVFVVLTLVVAAVIAGAGGDPLALVRLGTRYSLGDPLGSEGYDGQFVYYIARDPRPQFVAPLIDVPAYRYQRILMPLLARALAVGQEALIPWALALIGIAAHTAGTAIVAALLKTWNISRWYALGYGLWAGFILAVRLDLPEPLAYALAAGALLAQLRGRTGLSWLLYGLALFAREVTVLFIVGQLAADLFQRRWRQAAGLALTTLLPFALFQGWLWLVFGQPGIGSGGEMATGFELIPFMGLLRIGAYSPIYLAAMLAVFGPSVVLPSLWGFWRGVKSWISGDRNVIVFVMILHAAAVAFLPFSTFRETGGLLRFACGLILALLLYMGQNRLHRPLRYTILWIALNAFLLKT